MAGANGQRRTCSLSAKAASPPLTSAGVAQASPAACSSTGSERSSSACTTALASVSAAFANACSAAVARRGVHVKLCLRLRNCPRRAWAAPAPLRWPKPPRHLQRLQCLLQKDPVPVLRLLPRISTLKGAVLAAASGAITYCRCAGVAKILQEKALTNLCFAHQQKRSSRAKPSVTFQRH